MTVAKKKKKVFKKNKGEFCSEGHDLGIFHRFSPQPITAQKVEDGDEGPRPPLGRILCFSLFPSELVSISSTASKPVRSV